MFEILGFPNTEPQSFLLTTMYWLFVIPNMSPKNYDIFIQRMYDKSVPNGFLEVVNSCISSALCMKSFFCRTAWDYDPCYIVAAIFLDSEDKSNEDSENQVFIAERSNTPLLQGKTRQIEAAVVATTAAASKAKSQACWYLGYTQFMLHTDAQCGVNSIL